MNATRHNTTRRVGGGARTGHTAKVQAGPARDARRSPSGSHRGARIRTLAPLLVCALATAAAAQPPLQVPIGQITRLQGAMANPLRGQGLVTGLNGTGAGDRVSRQAAQNLIRRYGMNVSNGDLTSGSFALVMVNATLPPFAKEGQLLDVKVSTLSDATSLYGGVLQEVQLLGPDGEIYAIASGPLTVSGFAAAAGGTSVTRNHVTTANIAAGATVVEAPHSYFLSEAGHLELQLINPDLLTANNIAGEIGRILTGTGCNAKVVDRTLVQIALPADQQSQQDAIRVLNLVRPVPVRVHNPTVVVIDAAAGVVLAGAGVMISPCVVALADLTVSVISEDQVSQPLPGINGGETAIVNRTRIDIDTNSTQVQPVQGGATVDELLGNLRALELSPRQLIQVFEHLRAGGYLQAELIVR